MMMMIMMRNHLQSLPICSGYVMFPACYQSWLLWPSTHLYSGRSASSRGLYPKHLLAPPTLMLEQVCKDTGKHVAANLAKTSCSFTRALLDLPPASLRSIWLAKAALHFQAPLHFRRGSRHMKTTSQEVAKDDSAFKMHD